MKYNSTPPPRTSHRPASMLRTMEALVGVMGLGHTRHARPTHIVRYLESQALEASHARTIRGRSHVHRHLQVDASGGLREHQEWQPESPSFRQQSEDGAVGKRGAVRIWTQQEGRWGPKHTSRTPYPGPSTRPVPTPGGHVLWL